MPVDRRGQDPGDAHATMAAPHAALSTRLIFLKVGEGAGTTNNPAQI